MRKRKLWVSIFAGILAIIMILSLVVGVLPGIASGKKASSSELKAQLNALKENKKEIDKEIKDLESQLKSTNKDLKSIVNRKNTLDQQIFMMHEKVNNLNEQITAYNTLIADKQEELDQAQAHLTELNIKNKERIRAMEENGNLSYWSVLFKANSFADLLDRMSMVQEIAAADQRRLEEMSQAAEAVAETKATLETEREGLEENKKQLEESQVELEAKRKEADELLDELLATGKEYEELLDKAESEAKDLASDISDKKNEYDAAVKEEQESSKPSSSTTKPSSGDDYVASNAKWLVPCKYTRFTSAYGWRVHPVHKDWRFHYGVDLAGSKGTPIKATRSGKVTLATFGSSAGYHVKIDHGDGFVSIYMHMTHYIVKKGDKVEAGQVIGYMGSTGTSTGNHLHFGITYKGNYVNPAKYIDI